MGPAEPALGRAPVSNTWSWRVSSCPWGIVTGSAGHCGEMRFSSLGNKGALFSQANLPKQINRRTPCSPFKVRLQRYTQPEGFAPACAQSPAELCWVQGGFTTELQEPCVAAAAAPRDSGCPPHPAPAAVTLKLQLHSDARPFCPPHSPSAWAPPRFCSLLL